MALDAAPGRRQEALAVVGCIATAVALRLPFLGSIGPDEGGYAYVARQWAHGVVLYRGAWIDRPQGLILAYRLLVGLSSKPAAIRAAAILVAVLVLLLLWWIARELGGRRAGIAAAALYAVVGVGPHIEGFTLNGELVAALPATAAVAAAVRARTSRHHSAWLLAAGLAGGAALVTKQSAFDGLAVALVVAVAGTQRMRRIALVLAGAAVPVAASIWAGIEAGWPAYATALAGWQLTARGTGLSLGARADHLVADAVAPLRDLGLLALLATSGLVLPRRPGGRVPFLAAAWLCAAALGVNVGGLYWPHYFVQLVAPLVLCAALALAALPRSLARAAVFAVSSPTALFVGTLAGSTDRAADGTVQYARAYENDARIASWLRRHTHPGGAFYVLYSRADIYYLADRTAAFPYLWSGPLDAIPHALARLGDLLDGPRRPQFVVEAQLPGRADRGRIAAAIRSDYRLVWRSPLWHTPVLERR